ncbi:MAG: FAD-linked oxidase C-terminal domain-containing protein, partial [Candidatus Sulfotelmatobacter sp.]
VVQQSFIDHGATLSHHHAVGTEHLPWLTDDISPVGVIAVAAIKGGLDPGNVMNPGRLRPTATPSEEAAHVEQCEQTCTNLHKEERQDMRVDAGADSKTNS